MDFKEVIKAMKEGKKVTRPTFNEDNYLYLDGGIIKCFITKENAYFHYRSIEANDWEIVEEKKTLSDFRIEQTLAYPEDKIKEKLNEFIGWNKQQPHSDTYRIELKAKEIFGDKLI